MIQENVIDDNAENLIKCTTEVAIACALCFPEGQGISDRSNVSCVTLLSLTLEGPLILLRNLDVPSANSLLNTDSSMQWIPWQVRSRKLPHSAPKTHTSWDGLRCTGGILQIDSPHKRKLLPRRFSSAFQLYMRSQQSSQDHNAVVAHLHARFLVSAWTCACRPKTQHQTVFLPHQCYSVMSWRSRSKPLGTLEVSLVPHREPRARRLANGT